MAVLVRDIERPAMLDRPADGQLSFGAAATPAARRGDGSDGEGRFRRSSETQNVPLSERLRAERSAGSATVAGPMVAERSGGATLDELLVGAWEGLSSRHSVTCPVCTATMAPRGGAAGGACGDCGSQLR